MDRIVLASGSPRRREILKMVGVDFEVVSPDTEESLPEGTPPELGVRILAERKARAVRALPVSAGKTVVAADTLVSLDGQVFGKPESREDAFRMLSRLSGRTHQVFTGVCVLFPSGKKVSFTETSDSEFYELTEKEIRDYIATGEPMDKAGAYGIQGRGALLVKGIRGDFYNVMGLPAARLIRVLRDASPSE